MNQPSTTREALIVEALGEAERLIRQVEALAPALDQSRQALADAHSGLAGQLAAFEAQAEQGMGQAVGALLQFGVGDAARGALDGNAPAVGAGGLGHQHADVGHRTRAAGRGNGWGVDGGLLVVLARPRDACRHCSRKPGSAGNTDC